MFPSTGQPIIVEMCKFLFLLLFLPIFADVEQSLTRANTLLELGESKRALKIYQALSAQSLPPEQQLIIAYNIALSYLAQDDGEAALCPLQQLVNLEGIPARLKEDAMTQASLAFSRLSETVGRNETLRAHDRKALDKGSGQIQSAIASFKSKPMNSLPELIEASIAKQREALLLTKLLPFINPYQEPVTEVINFQRQLLEMPFVAFLEEQQRKKPVAREDWEEITDHYSLGLDLAKLASLRLEQKELPYCEVIPLQTRAVREFTEALVKLKNVSLRDEESYLTLPETSPTERLRALHREDSEKPEAIVPIPREGITW